MCGNSQQEPAARCKQVPKRNESFMFFVYVLENVEHADKVKLFAERATAHVPLDDKTR